jgi:hypothetical protein
LDELRPMECWAKNGLTTYYTQREADPRSVRGVFSINTVFFQAIPVSLERQFHKLSFVFYLDFERSLDILQYDINHLGTTKYWK